MLLTHDYSSVRSALSQSSLHLTLHSLTIWFSFNMSLIFAGHVHVFFSVYHILKHQILIVSWQPVIKMTRLSLKCLCALVMPRVRLSTTNWEFSNASFAPKLHIYVHYAMVYPGLDNEMWRIQVWQWNVAYPGLAIKQNVSSSWQ